MHVPASTCRCPAVHAKHDPRHWVKGACRLVEAEPSGCLFVQLLTFMTETMGSVSSDSRPITDSTCSQADAVRARQGRQRWSAAACRHASETMRLQQSGMNCS